MFHYLRTEHESKLDIGKLEISHVAHTAFHIWIIDLRWVEDHNAVGASGKDLREVAVAGSDIERNLFFRKLTVNVTGPLSQPPTDKFESQTLRKNELHCRQRLISDHRLIGAEARRKNRSTSGGEKFAHNGKLRIFVGPAPLGRKA